MNKQSTQHTGYAIFCRLRRFKQTAKGLRYAYNRLQTSLNSGDGYAGGWFLLCFDCADAAGRITERT